eukprot:EG_transcript_19614
MVQFLYDGGAVRCFLRRSSCPTAVGLAIASASFSLGCAAAVLLWHTGATLREAGTSVRFLDVKGVHSALWAFFFLACSVQSTFDAIRFWLGDSEPQLKANLTLGSLLAQPMALLCLSLALDHQRYPPPTVPTSPRRDLHFDDLRPRLLVLLAFVRAIATLCASADTFYAKPWTYWTLCTTSVVQFLPLVALVVLISFDNTGSAPPGSHKLTLALACAAQVPSCLPMSFWNRFVFSAVPFPCVGPYSFYDLLSLGHVVSILLYFTFFRDEFQRIKGRETYSLYREYQEAADFRLY